MARVVDVPLNTAIADLDEALRTLLKRELDKHGFEGVEIAFDAPSKEWSGKLTGPSVNLFLYDMREALDRAAATPAERRTNGADIASDVLAQNATTTLSRAETSVGRPREEKADFWTSVGGQYKASIDYVVQIVVESGATFVRGPEVRTTTIRTLHADGPRSTLEELHRIGGTVTDEEGAPLQGAWVAPPERR